MIPRRWHRWAEQFRRIAAEESGNTDDRRAEQSKFSFEHGIEELAEHAYVRLLAEGRRELREHGPPVIDPIVIPVLIRRDVAAAVIRLHRRRIAAGSFAGPFVPRAFTIRDRKGWVVLFLIQGVP